ncbi:MAG: homoserine kinase, partial [Vampirovibrionia bacterium]
PALLGGFVMSAVVDENTLMYRKLHWPEKWKIIISQPDFKLSTKRARAILPENVPLKDAIYNLSCCSFLVSAVCNGDEEALKHSLNDKLHQPYRSKLVPGLTTIMSELSKTKVLGTVLSGAGPSICVITSANNNDEVVDIIKTIWQKENIGCEFFFPDVDNAGLHYV